MGDRLVPHARYGWYVARHKAFVLVAGLRLRAPLWRLVVHDWSKLTPVEWGPYVRRFYGGAEPRRPDEFDRAWLHHQHHNPHHWQAHLLRRDDGEVVALEMPASLVREMVADWMGASRALAGSWDASGWYEAQAPKMVLHPRTRAMVEVVLSEQS